MNPPILNTGQHDGPPDLSQMHCPGACGKLQRARTHQLVTLTHPEMGGLRPAGPSLEYLCTMVYKIPAAPLIQSLSWGKAATDTHLHKP